MEREYMPFDLSAKREESAYEKFLKRPFDCFCAFCAIVVLSPILLVTAYLVRTKLGSPIIFKQPRPGLNEKVFTLYKFRTMTDERDENGKLLPDEIRLTKFGATLRNTSLDELPELFNILLGDMAVIGPRPQLVRDMVFMTPEQRKRHLVRPGLSGLAQVNGRNAISWENKLKYDLEYMKNISLAEDVSIIFQTINKAFVHQEDINADDFATAEDYGDMLLRTGQISQECYDKGQALAKEIIEKM